MTTSRAAVARAAVILSSLWIVACASTPNVGVRSGFENARFRHVSLSPVQATSDFGMSAAQWRELAATVDQDLQTQLGGQGFQTIDAEALRAQLESHRVWDTFAELVGPDRTLQASFEPSAYRGDVPPEVEALRQLSQSGAMSSDAVLFVELVYQSVGQCSVDPRAHNQFAVIVDEQGRAIEPVGSSDCAVTHMQAKLVDSKSAATVWHNRVLRELRAPTVSSELAQANMRAALRELVSGQHGLQPLARSSSSGLP